ncbi:MAG: N-acetylmuramoyl-L-alanine amidase [Aequorivita sp.]
MVRYKAFISLLLALELCGLHTPALAQMNSNKIMVIIIDPGHGGEDSGAVGVNGILEKDVVLNIAKEIVEQNQKIFKNRFEIYLTRYKDTLISLGDRTKLSKSLKADLFLSLHCNYADNPNAKGIEVYVSKKQGKYSRGSILQAYDIQKGLKENLGFESRGVKFADFQVLRETVNECPSVLLELGFLSNLKDNDYLKEKEVIDFIASRLLRKL